MRIIFWDRPLNQVHHVYVSIHTPFGEAIDLLCTHLGIRQEDWIFARGKTAEGEYIEVNKEHTGYALDKSDTDDMIIAFVLRDVNN